MIATSEIKINVVAQEQGVTAKAIYIPLLGLLAAEIKSQQLGPGLGVRVRRKLTFA